MNCRYCENLTDDTTGVCYKCMNSLWKRWNDRLCNMWTVSKDKMRLLLIR